MHAKIQAQCNLKEWKLEQQHISIETSIGNTEFLLGHRFAGGDNTPLYRHHINTHALWVKRLAQPTVYIRGDEIKIYLIHHERHYPRLSVNENVHECKTKSWMWSAPKPARDTAIWFTTSGSQITETKTFNTLPLPNYSKAAMHHSHRLLQYHFANLPNTSTRMDNGQVNRNVHTEALWSAFIVSTSRSPITTDFGKAYIVTSHTCKWTSPYIERNAITLNRRSNIKTSQ